MNLTMPSAQNLVAVDNLVNSATDFIKVRQLNFAIAGFITFLYVVLQYGGYLFKRKQPRKPRDRERERDRILLGTYRPFGRFGRSKSGEIKFNKKTKVPTYFTSKAGPRRTAGKCLNCYKCYPTT